MKWLMILEEVERIEAILLRIPSSQAELQASIRTAKTMTNENGVAVIAVHGALVSTREPMLDFFGVEQTAYKDINEQVTAAQTGFSSIILDVNSSGGMVEGLYGTMAAIKGSKIPVAARVSGKAASAAYMLASQAEKIIAEDDLTMFGSVGVATTMSNSKNMVEIANTDSPKKRPNAATDEGIGVVREELDDIYKVVSEKIAEGRGITPLQVNTMYGQGAMMTARKALAAGMIDNISKPAGEKNLAAKQKEKIKMTEEEKKAVYAEAFNAGVMAERGRVEAHLIMSDASGDFETSRAAIKNGDALTDTVKAKHMSAEIRKRSIEARGVEAPSPVVVESQKPGAGKIDKEKQDLKDLQAKNPGLKFEWRKN